MDLDALAKLMVRNGVQTDLSMFALDEQKQICMRAGEEFLRLDRVVDAIAAFERAGNLPVERLRKLAQSFLDLRDYKQARVLFMKIGDKDMVDFIQQNFL